MNHAFIIHGSYGYPEENWFPWLKKQLEADGFEVIVPSFPTPENQDITRWVKVWRKYEGLLDDDSILIGHSLGATFALTILERAKKSISASYLVAGFLGPLGEPLFDSINKTFIDKEFGWGRIRANCKKFNVFYSDNDPYVPAAEGQSLVNHLGAREHVVRGAGHFNERAGYKEFELLLKIIHEDSTENCNSNERRKK